MTSPTFVRFDAGVSRRLPAESSIPHGSRRPRCASRSCSAGGVGNGHGAVRRWLGRCRLPASPGDRGGLASSESTGMAAGARSVDAGRSGDSRRPAPLAAPALHLLTAPPGHRQSFALPSPRSRHPRGHRFASRRSLRSRLASLATDFSGVRVLSTPRAPVPG